MCSAQRVNCHIWHTKTHTHIKPCQSRGPFPLLSDKRQPSSSWTDIDDYLGSFLQSVVHLWAEMESISAGCWTLRDKVIWQLGTLSVWTAEISKILFPKFTSNTQGQRKKTKEKEIQRYTQTGLHWKWGNEMASCTFGYRIKYVIFFPDVAEAGYGI